MPMIEAVPTVTYPAAGVMVANPATAPVISPMKVGFFLPVFHSISNHVMAAKEADTSVLMKAATVMLFMSNSLPALKPYQPNQSRAVPIATNGMLLGLCSPSLRLPT